MSKLKDIALSFQCKESWDKMSTCDGGKFCQVCQKIVYDFSNFTKEEYHDFLNSKTVPFCGKFRLQQTVYQKSFLRSFQNWIYSLLVCLGFFSCKESLNEKQPVHPSVKQTNLNDTPFVMGDIPNPNSDKEADDCLGFEIPEYKYGGEEGMIDFFEKNLSMKDSIEGRALLEFTVNKSGRVKNCKILRSVSPKNDAEAIRVVKLLVFEKPKRDMLFQLPITFEIEGE